MSILLRLMLLGWLLAFSPQLLFAQERFRISNSSRAYDVEVTMASCDQKVKSYSPTTCSGPGKISIFRKGSTSSFQTFQLRNIEMSSDQAAYNPKVDKTERKLYDDEYSLVFDDFNFDGSEDLAVQSGREGGYGGPSYKVYLYNVNLKRFVENVRLSKLTEGYLGLFFADSKTRRLTAFSKSGCCYHETEIFKVVNNKPVLVEKIIEEATGTDEAGYVVTITTRKLVNGKWVKRVTRRKDKAEDPSFEPVLGFNPTIKLIAPRCQA